MAIYYQKVYDAGTSQWCYYSGTTIDPTPASGDTEPNWSGPISQHCILRVVPESTSDHGALTGLADDDHTQYLLANGSRNLTGNLAVSALVTIDGRDISVDGTVQDAHIANTSNPHSTTAAQVGAVPTSRTVTAGAGLTGGGALSGDITLNAIAHADASIVVAADSIQVGVLATDAQHGVRGGGTQHAVVVPAGAAGFMSGADKTKLDGIATGAVASHSALTGLSGDDHTQYLLTNGTRGMAGNLYPTTNGTRTLGTSALRWSEVHSFFVGTNAQPISSAYLAETYVTSGGGLFQWPYGTWSFHVRSKSFSGGGSGWIDNGGTTYAEPACAYVVGRTTDIGNPRANVYANTVNNSVTIELYVNGVASGFKLTISSSATGIYTTSGTVQAGTADTVGWHVSTSGTGSISFTLTNDLTATSP